MWLQHDVTRHQQMSYSISCQTFVQWSAERRWVQYLDLCISLGLADQIHYIIISNRLGLPKTHINYAIRDFHWLSDGFCQVRIRLERSKFEINMTRSDARRWRHGLSVPMATHRICRSHNCDRVQKWIRAFTRSSCSLEPVMKIVTRSWCYTNVTEATRFRS